MTPREIRFQVKTDKSGSLVPLEERQNIPFDIRRTFFIYGLAAGAVRGRHAQRTLKEVVICLKGSCKIRIEDASGVNVYELASPDTGLFIGPMEWREMYDFSTDCILLALADQAYDETDYIRSYEEYKRCQKK